MDSLHERFTAGIWLNKRYETISPLNHGSFGMVFLARDHLLDRMVAMKCLAKSTAIRDPNSPLMIDDRSEELKIHSRIAPNSCVVNLLNRFETHTQTFLVLEYCAMGDLYEAIQQDKGPKETGHVRDFMLQLMNAVEYLHSKGIFHRDIKPENIFLTADGNMKLGDFGLATMDVWSYESSVGSDRYMAPEQFDTPSAGLSPARADIWSVGICLLNILFSRNPFGVPARSDPLFSDFLRDRQSLFDVFPNMSQDTFEILTHCLAIDPAKRSLAKAKEALLRVISFTTDDESLDEFCTEDRDVVAATANREPLRTPSVSSPTNDFSATVSFPWAKALHMTTPVKSRQLSVIRDNESDSEDLFPSSEASTNDWFSKADSQSIDSIALSSARHSYDLEGTANRATSPASRSKPVPIAGSLPLFSGRAGQAISSFFGKRSKQPESKSWSDLWDEEEEERLRHDNKSGWLTAQPPSCSQIYEDSESDGRLTPRACLAELQNPTALLPASSVARNAKLSLHDGVNEHTGFVFEDHRPSLSVSTPGKPSMLPKRNSFLAKWTELGDRRRAVPLGPKSAGAAGFAARGKLERMRRNTAVDPTRPAALVSSKLRHDVYTSKDWRNSGDKLAQSAPPEPSQLNGVRCGEHDDAGRAGKASPADDALEFGDDDVDDHDDDDELGFVGGWKDLHL